MLTLGPSIDRTPRDVRIPRAQGGAVEARRARLAGAADPAIGEEPPLRRLGRHPRGLAALAFIALGLAIALGVLRVRARARVLELGAAITDLTDEHTRLRDERRRLEAERAFLRHPDQVAQVAEEHLGMIPTPPERIRRITLREAPEPVTGAAKVSAKVSARRPPAGDPR